MAKCTKDRWQIVLAQFEIDYPLTGQVFEGNHVFG